MAAGYSDVALMLLDSGKLCSVIGAQVGAALSTRLRGAWILRGLALALGFVGVRLLYVAWSFEAAR